MNIGNKIKKSREEKNISIEELSKLTNDTIDNIEKYENNELEPTLDKKLQLSKVLDLPLNELMLINDSHYKKSAENLTNKYNDRYDEEQDNEEKIVEEVKIEEPIGKSSVEYNDKVFDAVFVGRTGNIFIMSFIWPFSYVISAFIFLLLGQTVMAMIVAGFGLITFFPSISRYSNYKRTKREWLNTYNNVKRYYTFYDSYLIVKADDSEVVNNIYYSDFQTFVEQRDYLVGIIPNDSKQGLVLIIDRKMFGNGEYNIVKEAIKNKNKNFIPERLPSNNGENNKKDENIKPINQKFNRLLLVILIFTLLSSTIISFIITIITGGDNTLSTRIWTYGITIAISIACFAMGLISEIRYNKRSRKNIWIGLIMIVISIIQLVSYSSRDLIYKGNNDLEYYQKLEVMTEIELPESFYTIYRNDEIVSLTNNDENFVQTNQQIILFLKGKEIKQLLETIKTKWETTNIPYYLINDEAKMEIKSNGLILDNQPKYYTSVENEETTTYLMYFESSGMMLVVTYQK